MKILSTIFAVLFLFAFACTICFLFHIGGTEFTDSSTYDKMASVSFLEAGAFFYIYLKIENKIATK
jgi:hypothetical protein